MKRHENNNLLFMICARAGSKGVKGKNTRDFCGKPLVAYTVAAVDLFKKRFSKEFDQIVLAVNTDSEMLVQQLEILQIEYIYIPRTDELAGDMVSKKDVIKDTLIKCEKKTNLVFDIVVDLDLTSPMRTVEDIAGIIECLEKDKNADIVFSVTESRRSPYFNLVSQKEDGYYRPVIETQFVARQQCPECFDMNASIYAYRRAYALRNDTFPRNALIWKMKDMGVIDIDSEEDLKLMEVIGRYLFEGRREYQDIYMWVNDRGGYRE